MNEGVFVAFFKSFFPGMFGAFVTIFAKKKDVIKLACFTTLESIILLLIGGTMGWWAGGAAIQHYHIVGEHHIYMTRFLIGGFAFLVMQQVIFKIPSLGEQIPKILDAIRIKFFGG